MPDPNDRDNQVVDGQLPSDVRLLNDVIGVVTRKRSFCNVVGPRHTGKTKLLYRLAQALRTNPRTLPVFVDFRTAGARIESLLRMTDLVRDALRNAGQQAAEAVPGLLGSEYSFHTLLRDATRTAGIDVVLILCGLDSIDREPLLALLRVLRAVHAESEPTAPRLIVVLASSLRLQRGPLSPTSPFNIGDSVRVMDLPEGEAQTLAQQTAERGSFSLTPEGIAAVLRACGGDRWMIEHLVGMVGQRGNDRFHTAVDVEATVADLLDPRTRVSALSDTIHAIEGDSTLLRFTVRALHVRDSGASKETPIGVLDEDALILSGAYVRAEATGAVHWRSEIYRRALTAHFTLERVVDRLRFAGEWDSAFAVLTEAREYDAAAPDLLRALSIDFIRAAASEETALRVLARRVLPVFAADAACVVRRNTTNDGWEVLDSATGPRAEAPLSFEQVERVALAALEGSTQASREGDFFLYAWPLEDAGHDRGVLAVRMVEAFTQTFQEEALPDFLRHVRESLLTLRRRGAALQDAVRRYDRVKQLAAASDERQICQAALEAAVDDLHGSAEGGYVLLWNSDRRQLQPSATVGLGHARWQEIALQREQGFVGWAFANRQLGLLGDAAADPRSRFFPTLGVPSELSAAVAPLEAWNQAIGVIYLVNFSRPNAFREVQLTLLGRHALELAATLQNVRIARELYLAGLDSREGRREVREVFWRTAQAWLRLSRATALQVTLFHEGRSLKERLGDEPKELLWYPPLVSDAPPGPPESLALKALNDGTSVRASQAELGLGSEAEALGLRQGLCVPLRLGDRFDGVLCCYYGDDEEIADGEEKVLSLFGNQLALAMANARQLAELELTERLVWMGLEYSIRAHEVNAEIGRARLAQHDLERRCAHDSDALECLKELDAILARAATIPQMSVLPPAGASMTVNLRAETEPKLRRWIRPEDGVEVHWSMEAGAEILPLDSRRLQIVMGTLISNAVREMRMASERRLVIQSALRGSRVVVSVSDTGPGIGEERQRGLFDGDWGMEADGGGLRKGLAIMRRLLRRLGGDAKLVHTSSKGTTIQFWLMRPSSRNEP
jgi:hypothetical protein